MRLALTLPLLLLAGCEYDSTPGLYPALPMPGETAVPVDTYPSVWIGNFVVQPVRIVDGEEVLILPDLRLFRAADDVALPGVVKQLGAFVHFIPDAPLAEDTDYRLEVDLVDAWRWREPVYSAPADRTPEGRIAIAFSTRSRPAVVRAHWSGGLGTEDNPYGLYVMFSQPMDDSVETATILVDGQEYGAYGYYEEGRTEYDYFGRQHMLYLYVPHDIDLGRARLLLRTKLAADGTPLVAPWLIDPED